MTTKDLLGPHNLELGGMYVPYHLDVDPPPVILTELAKRTGADLDRLQAMTWAGWVPCLFDQVLRPHGGQVLKIFYTYVRSNTVLMPHGEAPLPHEGLLRGWGGPWHPQRLLARQCPVCAVDPGRGRYLVWQLPLVLGCGEHGCYLEDPFQVANRTLTHGQPMEPRPIPEPLATLERYTHAALTTGRVDLPGRTVQAAVWFRLLRSLLDEVSLALSTRHAQPRATLERIWAATGLPERGGLNVWQVYEHLNPTRQHDLMIAAATALDLAAKAEITAQGRLASAIQSPRGRYVYDGDRPPVRTAWQDAVAQIEQQILTARTDPEAARQLLTWLTSGCRTITSFEQQRAYLFGAGIPAAFLSTAACLGRTDLL